MSIDDIAKDASRAGANEANADKLANERIGGLFPLSELNGKRTVYGARSYIVLCSSPEAATTIRERLSTEEYDIIHVSQFENAARYLSIAYKGEDKPELQLLRSIASVIGDVDSKAEAFIPAERKTSEE